MPMNIGQVIRALREERGWSQEKVALDAGMATSYVSRIERGERRLPTTRLEQLAAVFGRTAADIYALAEGRSLPRAASKAEGDATVDYTSEAVQLRRSFRALTPANRRIAVELLKALERIQA